MFLKRRRVSSPKGGALDEARIRDFLDTDYQRLVSGLTLVLGSQPAAEDAVQEAVARAWERSERGEHIDVLAAWVAVVATNVARSAMRRMLTERRLRKRVLPSNEGSRENSVVDRADVIRSIRSLPRRQREVIVLHYYLDLSVAEIARAVGRSEGAVKNALHRARHSLLQIMAPRVVEAGEQRG